MIGDNIVWGTIILIISGWFENGQSTAAILE